MGGNRKLRRWSIADRVSVVVVLGAILTVGLGWRSGAIGGVHQEMSGQATEGLVAEACDTGCTPRAFGISGDPATGMPYHQ